MVCIRRHSDTPALPNGAVFFYPSFFLGLIFELNSSYFAILDSLYMPNCKTVVPYRGSPEQEERLRQVIAEHRGQPGATMPVLQAAQEIFGYLPEEVQIMVAEGLDIPLSEVYGVASFYAQFSMNPKGKYQISVCLGTACYVKGAAAVLNAVEQKLGIVPGAITPDGKFSLDSCRCVGACGLAPVMMINNDVYGRLTPDQVGPILDMYK